MNEGILELLKNFYLTFEAKKTNGLVHSQFVNVKVCLSEVIKIL